MKTKLKITRYQDGGHSWFKVARKLLEQLNISDKISGYSYQYGDNAYLEEDCDASIFFRAYLGLEENAGLSWEMIQNAVKVDTKFNDSRSKIRNYDRYDKDFKKALWKEGKQVMLYGKPYTMKLNKYGKKVLTDGFRDFTVTKKQLSEVSEVETNKISRSLYYEFLIDKYNALCYNKV